MATSISRKLPTAQLRKLNFLVGESDGLETLYLPDSPPVQFQAIVNGSWETCERFVRIEFYANIPGIGIETFHTMITYSESKECYRLWCFAASQEEPIHMHGDFVDGALVFVSDPTSMICGMQRLRYTFTPRDQDTVELLGERWEPDGYVRYCSVVFHPCCFTEL